MIQWVLVVRQVLMQRDLRTEEEVMGKEQPAIQHSHLEFPGTRASAENMYRSQNDYYNRLPSCLFVFFFFFFLKRAKSANVVP